MNPSLRRSLIFSCLLGVALDAQTPNVKQRSATSTGGDLWGVKSGAVWIPYRYDADISDKAAAIWTLNMNRWQKLTRGRVNFAPLTSAPTGNWVQLRSDHAKIGSCGVGAGSPTNCQVRDSSILGIGMMVPVGATTTIYADLALNFGSRDDLQGVAFENYVTVDPPNQPGTSSPLQIASIEYQSDGKLVTWYEPGSINANSGYKLWRSKGSFTDLDAAAGVTAVSLPAGVDAVFNAKHQGSTLRGAAISGNDVYTYWNVGSTLKVARGSTTDLDSVESLQTVTLPSGKTMDDLVDMTFDEKNILNTWFVDDYTNYGSGILVPNSYRRYVGTYRDLDGASNDNGVVGDTIKASNLGAALHELGHALGFIHEHQRADRDKYVWVDPEADAKNYGKKNSTVIHSSFDFASIMHYKNSNTGRLDAKHTPLPGNNSLMASLRSRSLTLGRPARTPIFRSRFHPWRAWPTPTSSAVTTARAACSSHGTCSMGICSAPGATSGIRPRPETASSTIRCKSPGFSAAQSDSLFSMTTMDMSMPGISAPQAPRAPAGYTGAPAPQRIWTLTRRLSA